MTLNDLGDNVTYSYEPENMLTGTVDGTGWVVTNGTTRTSDDGSLATFHLTNNRSNEDYIYSPPFTLKHNTNYCLTFNAIRSTTKTTVDVYVLAYGDTRTANDKVNSSAWIAFQYTDVKEIGIADTSIELMFNLPENSVEGQYQLRFDNNGAADSTFTYVDVDSPMLCEEEYAAWAPASGEPHIGSGIMKPLRRNLTNELKNSRIPSSIEEDSSHPDGIESQDVDPNHNHWVGSYKEYLPLQSDISGFSDSTKSYYLHTNVCRYSNSSEYLGIISDSIRLYARYVSRGGFANEIRVNDKHDTYIFNRDWVSLGGSISIPRGCKIAELGLLMNGAISGGTFGQDANSGSSLYHTNIELLDYSDASDVSYVKLNNVLAQNSPKSDSYSRIVENKFYVIPATNSGTKKTVLNFDSILNTITSSGYTIYELDANFASTSTIVSDPNTVNTAHITFLATFVNNKLNNTYIACGIANRTRGSITTFRFEQVDPDSTLMSLYMSVAGPQPEFLVSLKPDTDLVDNKFLSRAWSHLRPRSDIARKRTIRHFDITNEIADGSIFARMDEGNFDGVYLGDTFKLPFYHTTSGGVQSTDYLNFEVVDIDKYYGVESNTGTSKTKHHIVCLQTDPIPSTWLSSAGVSPSLYTSTYPSTGGYANSNYVNTISTLYYSWLTTMFTSHKQYNIQTNKLEDSYDSYVKPYILTTTINVSDSVSVTTYTTGSTTSYKLGQIERTTITTDSFLPSFEELDHPAYPKEDGSSAFSITTINNNVYQLNDTIHYQGLDHIANRAWVANGISDNKNLYVRNMQNNVGSTDHLPMPAAYSVDFGDISDLGGIDFKSSTEVCGICPVIVLGY